MDMESANMPIIAPHFRLALKSIADIALLALASTAIAQEPALFPVPAPATAAPTTGRPDPSALKPFMEVLKGSKEMKGFFTLHQKDEKVWVEIRPEQLGMPFFFSVNIPNSVGERGLYAGQMGKSHIAVFKRIGNQIQLIAKNTEFIATPGTPQALAVSQAFSDSLLSSAAVVSAPHPETRAFLVDANALLFSDIPGYATRIDAAYRMAFSMDVRNTSFIKVRTDESLSGFQVNAHFSVPRIFAPPLTASALATPSAPSAMPDPRSFFVGFYYSFAALPMQPMHARIADDRVGHFVTTRQDFTEDLAPKIATHFVNRWRLEKKDPSLEISEPRQPIVFWLDKNIPEKYRKTITEAVLEWNQAFEKIGFKNALIAKQQTEKDDFDTLDARHASIRWFVGSDVGFARGPSQVDPRSGEILDADVAMSDVFARGARRLVTEDAGRPFVADGQSHGDADHSYCNYAHEATQEMDFALDLLEARGTIDMSSAEADRLAQAYVKAVIMHEIGHTLGLRHNFRSSTIYSLKQVQDPEFTRKNGLAGSVMDYIPFNLALKNDKQGEYVMSTLGPYDYWAIEYAYKPIDAAEEKLELGKIAVRSNEPLLAYGTDEDAGGNVFDPDVNVFDLGGDPLEYVRKRLALSRELWDRLQSKQLKAGESYETLRRSFDNGFSQFMRTVPVAVKFVGGVTFLRDHAGTGRASFTPVPVQQQRAALAMITNNLFTVDSFQFTPDLVSRLGVDHFDSHNRADVSIAGRTLSVQIAALDQLMSDAVANRLIDSREKVADGAKVLALSELYDTLQTAIWSELRTGKEITGMRRNLQREHLKRTAFALLRSSQTTPADARSLQRANAIELQQKIRVALGRRSSKEVSAHLAESLNTLTEALKAPLQRTGV